LNIRMKRARCHAAFRRLVSRCALNDLSPVPSLRLAFYNDFK
jgi:hypothetical protein